MEELQSASDLLDETFENFEESKPFLDENQFTEKELNSSMLDHNCKSFYTAA